MIIRVSNLDLFRVWRQDEDLPTEMLWARLRGKDEPTAQMEIGTDLHWALERMQPGQQFDVIHGRRWKFIVETDAELHLPATRELRCSKGYGAITVSGQVDALEGLVVYDHKTTGQVDAERYFSGYQWRYYLDIFGANEFIWNVFEIREDAKDPLTIYIKEFHRLSQHRYADLGKDCADLAAEFEQFARKHMPEEFE